MLQKWLACFSVMLLFVSSLTMAENMEQASEKSKLKIETCHLKGIKEQVKCGSLWVPENYNNVAGEQISINFAVIPAIDNSENKQPFMFLAGGPGQAAVELASPILSMFKDIRKTHDILFIDQRGTGKSHPLNCTESEKQNVYQVIPEDFTEQEITDCIAEFKGDTTQYNSENAIRDFDEVRKALGYKTVNVYGGSYGTRAALVYLRMFPNSLRSVVLDSVGPIEVPIGTFGLSSAQSFDKLIRHCASNTACQQAFPNLAEEFKQLQARLEKPITVSIQHPRLGTKTDLVLNNSKLINLIRLQLYNVQTRSLVPLVIHQAFLENYRPIAGLLAQSENGLGMYMGLTFNIVCNEDVPRITPEMLAKDADNDFGGNASHFAWLKACPLWPQYRPSETFYQPVTANVPTLILSGGLDPVTPISNGEKSAATLPNSHHIIVPNSAHIVASHSCAPLIISEFIEKLTPNELDESCLKDVPEETFMTSLNGSI
jgi:pimeloyl-ACP methyl ester carboxylesterase